VIEQWRILTLEPGPRPALILDVSESAQPYWPVLRSLTEGVLETLPRAGWPRLFFLGGNQQFDSAEFPEQAQRWFEANAGRGSFIGPIFELLVQEPEMAVAVVGSGRIFDLPDWKEEPIAARTTWCKYGPHALTEGAFEEESYASEQLAERLNNPAVRVEIGGPGVMPVWWDDPAFRLENGMLIGEKTTGSLRLGVLAPDEDSLTAAVVLTDGTRRPLRIEPCEMPQQANWCRLPQPEFTLLRQSLRKNCYQCPVCNLEHLAGQWRCPQAPDRPLFATLERFGHAGFALIDSGAWDARVRHHACETLQLNSQTVAVRRAEGGADVLRFDSQTGEWKAAEKIPLFYWMDDKLHALVL
jgi:hypothetical protein